MEYKTIPLELRQKAVIAITVHPSVNLSIGYKDDKAYIFIGDRPIGDLMNKDEVEHFVNKVREIKTGIIYDKFKEVLQ